MCEILTILRLSEVKCNNPNKLIFNSGISDTGQVERILRQDAFEGISHIVMQRLQPVFHTVTSIPQKKKGLVLWNDKEK